MILLFVAIIAVIELARRLPLIPAFREMSACSARSMRLVSRRGVSEWCKERAMRILALRLLGASLWAGALLVLAASPLLLTVAIATADPRIIEMGDWRARLWMLPLTLSYALLRWQIGRRVRAR
ncbi:MAG: hypothetical protein EOP61_06250 [Sphingomonadales bacterium]|nr:MAG: hypothetical protein EOP61_06250 [Sphingomonadales bacterium]